MQQTPKMLKALVNEWAVDSFIVSFKLETDSAIVAMKAQSALEKYGHKVGILLFSFSITFRSLH